MKIFDILLFICYNIVENKKGGENMEKLTACQTYTAKDYHKVYFANNKGDIKKVVTMCKAKDLLTAIN